MKIPNRVITLYVLVLFFKKINGIKILPSLVWDPWNPLFACQDPTIKVHQSNFLNFLCPPDKYHASLSDNSARGKIYENLYLLNTDENAFNNCDATSGKKLLTCDGTSPTSYDVKFEKFSSSSDIPDFKQGETYYMIGTGFRTKDNIDNKVNGSCSKIDKQGEYRLRLKIYICKQEEIDKGECQLCQTQGCYYKDCGKKCSPWEQESNSRKNNTTCTIRQKRICNNTFFEEVQVEYNNTEIRCNSTCSAWTEIGTTGNNDDCKAIRRRNCTNNLLQEWKIEIDSSKPCTKSSTAASSADDANGEDNTNFYITLAFTFICFVIGLLLGIICYKKYHARNCMNRERRVGATDNYVNDGFDMEDAKRNSKSLKSQPFQNGHTHQNGYT